jgi:hypothetical protein
MRCGGERLHQRLHNPAVQSNSNSQNSVFVVLVESQRLKFIHMNMHILNARRVAEKLSRNEISRREGYYYLVASFMLATLTFYVGLQNANPLWSWLSIYEGVVVLVVYWHGFTRTYDAAGADENRDFIFDFTCLYVPVWLTTTVAAWLIYWVVTHFLRGWLVTFANSELQFNQNLSKIGGDLFGLLIFLTAVVCQVVVFFRLTKLLAYVREHRVTT